MAKYAPKAMELAPRDITARSIQTEINEGRGINGQEYVYLDLRHLGEAKIAERLPGIRDLAIHFEGVDPVSRAGARSCPASTTRWAASTPTPTARPCSPGLYAAGECACVSVHGANRLGGNSLLETIVFGRRAGAAAAAFIAGGGAGGADGAATARAAAGALAAMRDRVERLRHGSEQPYAIRADMIATMKEHFGVFRDERRMSEGLEKMRALKERARHVKLLHERRRVQPRPHPHHRARGHGRRGPRHRDRRPGAHRVARFARAHRLPRSRRRALAQAHPGATTSPAGPRLESKPVTLGMFEPQERRY